MWNEIYVTVSSAELSNEGVWLLVVTGENTSAAVPSISKQLLVSNAEIFATT